MGLGTTEILLIIVVIVLLFGAKRIPDLARAFAARMSESPARGPAPHATISFTNEDIVRHPLVTKIVKAFDRAEETEKADRAEA